MYETKMAQVIIQIKELSTNETIEYSDNSCFINDNESINTFIYEEGNYCCDCNRKILFYRFKGKELEDEETPCSKDKNYYLVNVLDTTRKILYKEFEI